MTRVRRACSASTSDTKSGGETENASQLELSDTSRPNRGVRALNLRGKIVPSNQERMSERRHRKHGRRESPTNTSGRMFLVQLAEVGENQSVTERDMMQNRVETIGGKRECLF